MSFLTLPLTIREQIYTDLLTYVPSTTFENVSAPSSPICALLAINNQIYREVFDFLKSRLCILIETNNISVVNDIVEDAASVALPIISQLKSGARSSGKDVSKFPFSLKLDFYIFDTESSSESFPAFLIPVSSLKTLVNDILWLPKWMAWNMQASLSFQLVDTFLHSQEKAEELLIKPWLGWFIPRHFVGIETDASISEELGRQLKGRLMGDYAATGHLRKLQSLSQSAVVEAQSGKWDAAVERLVMAGRYTKVLYHCHLPSLRRDSTPASPTDFLLHLWVMATEIGSNHIQCLLNAGRPDDSNTAIPAGSGSGNPKFVEAREIGENYVTFMSMQPVYMSKETLNDKRMQDAIRKIKAKVSFRLHMACKGLGDVEAAVGYLREALKYEPETAIQLTEMIDELVSEGAKDSDEASSGVVRWEAGDNKDLSQDGASEQSVVESIKNLTVD